MKHYLTVFLDNEKQKTILLNSLSSFENGEIKIGRADDNDIILPFPSVSRHHAVLHFNGDVAEIIDAMNSFKKLKKALGKDNYMYRIIMDALNEKMNSDIESYFESEYETEMMYAEAIIQKLETGSYIDLNEMKKYIKHKKWQDVIISYAAKHGIQ